MSATQFWGTWQLQSFEIRSSDGEVSYPYGRDATGYLIYTEDGYMAVALMNANRANFHSADMLEGSSDEKQIAFNTFASYCGTYGVQEDKVVHHVQASLFPNWSGSDQVRFYKFSGDQLVLSTPLAPAKGKEQTAVAVWRRTKADQRSSGPSTNL
jgi:hypothetical protein